MKLKLHVYCDWEHFRDRGLVEQQWGSLRWIFMEHRVRL